MGLLYSIAPGRLLVAENRRQVKGQPRQQGRGQGLGGGDWGVGTGVSRPNGKPTPGAG